MTNLSPESHRDVSRKLYYMSKVFVDTVLPDTLPILRNTDTDSQNLIFFRMMAPYSLANVFAYTFVIMISLIAVANVFNTN